MKILTIQIGLAAGIASLLAFSLALRPTTQPVKRHVHAKARPTVVELDSPETVAAAPQVSHPIDLPHTALKVEDARLQEWLLGLPDSDLARLAETEALDNYVARVIDEIEQRQLHEDARLAEIDNFLGLLHVRIDQAHGYTPRG